MKELNALVQEIVDFGDVISYSENPADPNFQNACDLFSQYLDWKFTELKQQLTESDALNSDPQWDNSDLEGLNKLISSPMRSAETYITWTRELMQYCVNLQRNKLIAA